MDFRKARLRDPQWWKQTYILLRGLERQLNFQAHDAGYRYYLAQVSHGNLTPESFESVQAQAQAMYYEVVNSLRPWEKQAALAQHKQEFADYRQQYIDMVGVDPMDPQFKEWQVQRIAEDEAQRTAQKSETLEQTIARRAAERELKRKARKPK